jgi:hypothetical protein
MTAHVDGIAVPITVVDEHTATLIMPSHSNGAAVITIDSGNGLTSSLDPGFIYGANSGQSTGVHAQIAFGRRFSWNTTARPSVRRNRSVPQIMQTKPGQR